MEIKDLADAQKFIETMTSKGKSKNKLREANLSKQSNWLLNEPSQKKFRESMVRQFGIDPITQKDKFDFENINLNDFRESLNKQLIEKGRITEADSQTSFSQFLKAGLQQVVNGMYNSVDTSYEDWVTVITSQKTSEPFAPNHGVSFPKEVGNNMKYPEVAAAALDMQLRNKKFGSLYAVEYELLEDDQSGTFQRNAGYMGEYMKLLWEVLCYGKLASVSGMQYDQFKIPVSETKPSNEATYPYSTALQGGGANRPAAYAALSQSKLQDGIIALMNQKNLHGLKLQVNPNRLLVGPELSFDAAVLLNSAYYPSGAASTGDVGGAFAINPVKGIADLTVSRFMFKNDGSVSGDSKAWYLCDDAKPWFILQMREAVSVVQEATNSGQGFDQDVIRFKARSRGNADHIDPRFVWQGNDGSV